LTVPTKLTYQLKIDGYGLFYLQFIICTLYVADLNLRILRKGLLLMFKFRFIGLLLIASSTQVIAVKLTWDNREDGTGLHVSSQGKDQQEKNWELREVQEKDTQFYQNLFANSKVIKTVSDVKTATPEKTEIYVNKCVNRFLNGIPSGIMTIEQDHEPIGSVQLRPNGKPGVGEVYRAFKPSAQGKGLGKAAFGFLVEEWAPAVRQIGLGQDIDVSPSTVKKFKCFKAEALRLIATAARPSNPASWKCYKYFDFYPSPPTDETYEISSEGWEQSQHGPLEDYIISKHFSPFSSDRLQLDVLYSMLDETGDLRTISYIEAIGSVWYHFEREVK